VNCLHILHLTQDIQYDGEDCDNIDISNDRVTFDGRKSDGSGLSKITWSKACIGVKSEPLKFMGDNIIVIGIHFKEFQKAGMLDASVCKNDDNKDWCPSLYCPGGKAKSART
jgi:hypothetical protein